MGRKARRKSSADEQELHKRPTGRDELAQHSEVPSFACPGGKCSGWVAEVFVLTWGDLSGIARRECGGRQLWEHGG